jgi:hypothetical protein
MSLFSKKSQFWLPVTIRRPADDGEVEEFKFDALVRFFKRSELAKLSGTYLEQAKSLIVDWKGVAEDDGTVVPFSLEALTQLDEDHPNAMADIVESYSRAWRGAREKN